MDPNVLQPPFVFINNVIGYVKPHIRVVKFSLDRNTGYVFKTGTELFNNTKQLFTRFGFYRYLYLLYLERWKRCLYGLLIFREDKTKDDKDEIKYCNRHTISRKYSNA